MIGGKIPQPIIRTSLSAPYRSEAVDWAVPSFAAPVEYMGVDHRGFDILMAKEFLNRADVIPVFQQVGRKGVPEGVTAHRLA
jgi:hypothetical protein